MPEDSLSIAHEEAVSSEQKDRDVGMLGLPELIAGIEVAPLTIRRLSLLTVAKNPFACWKPEYFSQAPIESMLEFVWYVRPEFAFQDDEKRLAALALLVLVDAEELREGIRQYLDRAFLDCAMASDGVSFYSLAAGFYHSLNTSYPNAGWTRNMVLDEPLRAITQIVRAASEAKGCILVNRRSYAVKGRMLDRVESWEVDAEEEIDPFIETKRTEGWGLFEQPMPRGKRWLITMRRLTDGQ